jgi:hypothetical protein
MQEHVRTYLCAVTSHNERGLRKAIELEALEARIAQYELDGTRFLCVYPVNSTMPEPPDVEQLLGEVPDDDLKDQFRRDQFSAIQSSADGEPSSSG